MNGGILIARLFGIDVRVSMTLAVMAGLVVLIGADAASTAAPDLAGPLQWLLGVGVSALFVVSVLVHELAHALVGRRRGVATTSVTLGLVGGLAPPSIEATRPGDELAIAVAGPLVSLAIGAVLLPASLGLSVAAPAIGPLAGALFVVGALNVMVGLASLLPGLPLDGGRVVRALAWRRTGDRDRASLATARVGRLLGWAITLAGIVIILLADPVLGLLVVALGWLLGGASRGLEQRAQLERAVRGVTVADAMLADVPWVGPSLTLDVFAGQLGAGGAPRALPVVDDGRVLGVIGAGALRRVGQRRYASTRAADVMASPPQTPLAAPGDAIWPTMETMQRQRLDGLAVVEDGRLVGLVTRESASEAMRARLPATMFWRGRGR